MADDVRSTPSSTLRIACIVLYMYKSKIGRNKRVCSAHNNKSDKRTQFLKFVHWRFCKHHIYVIHNSVKLFFWNRVCANVGWRSERINLNKWDRKPQETPGNPPFPQVTDNSGNCFTYWCSLPPRFAHTV